MFSCPTTTKPILVLSFLLAPLPALSSASAPVAYLPINAQWGYVRLSNSPDGCEVYVARTVNGRVIIKPPIYRTGKFIFTTSLTGQDCIKSNF